MEQKRRPMRVQSRASSKNINNDFFVATFKNKAF
jgi:hypothetical protein